MWRSAYGYLLLILVFFISSTPGLAQTDYVPQKVIVQFSEGITITGKNSTGLAGFDRVATRYQVNKITRVYPFLDHLESTEKTAKNLSALRRTYYVDYGARVKPERVARDLSGERGVVYAEPIPIYRVHGTVSQEEPDDAMYEEQTYLRYLRLPEAWEVVKGESQSLPVVIAIVDGGFDWRHLDLIGNVWTNEDEIPGNGLDDDDNGFIDDVHGVNFANEDKLDNDPKGVAAAPGNTLHGTGVAGVASAVTDNGIGIAGAAWNAQLMHINVSCPNYDGDMCYGYEGILYAAMNGADIINVSWGSTVGDQLSKSKVEALDLATDLGALIVAAAGNESLNNDEYLSEPSGYFRVLSVGATKKDSRRKVNFSQYGRTVNVFAPGLNIVTTAPNNSYDTASGTSFSSPLVAGVAALIKTRFPEITPDALREQLRLASESMDSENPVYAGRLGRGYVNALASLRVPVAPGVRVQRWSWSDTDGNGQVHPGEEVTVTVDIANYLADAEQLVVEFVGVEPYPFLLMVMQEVSLGRLARDTSAGLEFRFRVDEHAPPNQIARFYVRIREGEFTDVDGSFTFGINPQAEVVYPVLRALYESTGGDNWHQNRGWDFTSVPTAEELSRWARLQTNKFVLTGLNLHSNNLVGSIPAELGQLSTLEWLYLSDNSLKGAIPAELGQFQQLGLLYLYDNKLFGSIPVELGQLSRLKQLDLSRNSLSGPIPESLGQLGQLTHIFLGDNSLSGLIPQSLGRLSSLERLDVSKNSLAGSIPVELGQLSQLRQLDLSRNSLSGPIPESLGQLGELIHLSFRVNSLSGPIPESLGQLGQLETLILSENSLAGSIPESLGQLSQLQWLFLKQNSLSGSIPESLGQLSQLTQLDLSQNSLSGSIPESLGQLSQLTRLNLSQNSLSGLIPESLGQLSQLTWLNLSQNSLSGSIPESLGQLSQLETLILSENSFTGYLPRSLMQLENLKNLFFGGQALCAPSDEEFQAYMRQIPFQDGLRCAGPVFNDQIVDQSYGGGQTIQPLVLPEATGIQPISYTITPTLPTGLSFDPETRTIHGTPVDVLPPTTFTYTATDANGVSVTQQFQLDVYIFSVGTETEGVPTEFAVHANYPNPFRQSTRMVFDLPWPARVQIDVMDVLGRQVHSSPPEDMEAGFHEMEWSGTGLPSGAYLYRLRATSHERRSVHVGRLIRL